MQTSEVCGWQATDTPATVHYSGGATAKNMVIAKETSGSCAEDGDPGGPVYTVDSSGRALARGSSPAAEEAEEAAEETTAEDSSIPAT